MAGQALSSRVRTAPPCAEHRPNRLVPPWKRDASRTSDLALTSTNLLAYGDNMREADQQPNFVQSYFHGTKCNLGIGDLIIPGNDANYGPRKAKFVYASSNLNVAIWAAELAVGDGPGRIYVVEPLGPMENDPNLTDKKFAGNPTNSYRVKTGFKVVAEVKDWQGHPPDEIRAAREKVNLALKNGAPIIED